MGRVKDKHEAALARFPAPIKTDGHPEIEWTEDCGCWRGQVGQFAAYVNEPFGVQEKWQTMRNMEIALSTAWALEKVGLTVNGEVVG